MNKLEQDTMNVIVWNIPRLAEALERIAKSSATGSICLERDSLDTKVILFALRFLQSNFEDDVLELIEENFGLTERGTNQIIEKLTKKLEGRNG